MEEIYFNCDLSNNNSNEYFEEELDGKAKLIALISGPFSMATLLFGIVGNVNILMVIAHISTLEKFNSRFISSVIILALCNTITLISSIEVYVLPYCIEYFMGYNPSPSMLKPLAFAISNSFRTASIWMVLYITFQRFRAVSQPFLERKRASTIKVRRSQRFTYKHPIEISEEEGKIKRNCNKNNFNDDYSFPSLFMHNFDFNDFKIPLLVVFVAIIYSIPNYLEVKIIRCPSGDTKIIQTALRENWWYRVILRVIIKSLFEMTGPFILVLSLTIATQLIIARSMKQRKLLTGQLERRRQLEDEALLKTPECCSTNDNGEIVRINILPGPIQKQRSSARQKLACHLEKFQNQRQDNENNINITAVMLAIKFLILHSLTITLDTLEAFEYTDVEFFNLLVAISNLFVLLDLSTNCLLYARWKRKNKENGIIKRGICDVMKFILPHKYS
ncbi:GPCR, rhodopsin-like, 7TM domain-containing protein [Strongyloides ratti]|uniref:GPCR, rhodopsin-like, 7TM domain-containing protein n=1 Tax=Strongyloides ratti TaxID=34506 RepID=A0A090LHP7_STRRB|nr:GPCR, rhodopsin-like, 7TM domain-containing protein [Strongyloides ratti]CEF69247.1 GPCR, rhodopsin-like, 7TM domain-containing protein [Strongyloides ratti]